MKIVRTIVSIPFFILLFKILNDYQSMLVAYSLFGVLTLLYYIFIDKYRAAEAIIITAVCFALGYFAPVSVGRIPLPF